MKKIAFALILILVFPFIARGMDGQGAKAFTDGFTKTYNEMDKNKRANEALKLERERLELQRQEQEHQQRLEEQQRRNAEQQKNSLGSAKNIIDMDGDDWTGFAEAIKIGYILGFQSGTYGVIIGNLQKNAKNRDSKAWNNQLVQYYLGKITVGQIINGLDVLYGDFKNKQIKLVYAVYIVKKQINGASSEEIEAILQYLRSNMDSSKLYFIDKDGKKKKVDLP